MLTLDSVNFDELKSLRSLSAISGTHLAGSCASIGASSHCVWTSDRKMVLTLAIHTVGTVSAKVCVYRAMDYT